MPYYEDYIDQSPRPTAREQEMQEICRHCERYEIFHNNLCARMCEELKDSLNRKPDQKN